MPPPLSSKIIQVLPRISRTSMDMWVAFTSGSYALSTSSATALKIHLWLVLFECRKAGLHCKSADKTAVIPGSLVNELNNMISDAVIFTITTPSNYCYHHHLLHVYQSHNVSLIIFFPLNSGGYWLLLVRFVHTGGAKDDWPNSHIPSLYFPCCGAGGKDKDKCASNSLDPPKHAHLSQCVCSYRHWSQADYLVVFHSGQFLCEKSTSLRTCLSRFLMSLIKDFQRMPTAAAWKHSFQPLWPNTSHWGLSQPTTSHWGMLQSSRSHWGLSVYHGPLHPTEAHYSPLHPTEAHYSPLHPIEAYHSPLHPIEAHYSPLHPTVGYLLSMSTII